MVTLSRDRSRAQSISFISVMFYHLIHVGLFGPLLVDVYQIDEEASYDQNILKCLYKGQSWRRGVKCDCKRDG